MRFSIRIDDENDTHTRFTVFANGANGGSVCLRTDEFEEFRHRLVKRATRFKLASGAYRAVDYDHDPPDEDCPKCETGCDNCQGGVIPFEWSIDWDELAARRG